MINLSNESKTKDGLLPSFNSDLKRFVELIKGNEFSIQLTKEIFDFYEKNKSILENQSIYGFAYWNRFTNEIVIKMETDLYKIRTELPFANDLLSYFTIIDFNEFDLKNWLYNSKGSDPISSAARSLKEKMDSQFEDWYKQLFEATTKNSLLPLDYYYSEFKVTPIDFLSKDEQLENYWLNLELFSSQNDDENYAVLNLGTSLLSVSKFIFDKDLNLKEPFSYYKDQLIDYVLEKLENTDNLLIGDLNSLLELIKKIEFSKKITEEFIHFHCLRGDNKLIYVIWNRFTKNFDFKVLQSKELTCDDCNFNDFISYFTVLKIDSKIYKRKQFKDLPKEK